MALQGISIATGATISASGGTAKTYSLSGKSMTSGIVVADASVTDFLIRPEIAWQARLPVLQRNGSYSKGHYVMQVTIPRFHPTTNEILPERVRVDAEWAAGGTTAITSILNLAAQGISLSAAQNFWLSGSLA